MTSDDIMDLYEIEEHIGTMIPEGELPSEAEFNQYRAKATEWIERNSLKEQASNAPLSKDQNKRPINPLTGISSLVEDLRIRLRRLTTNQDRGWPNK